MTPKVYVFARNYLTIQPLFFLMRTIKDVQSIGIYLEDIRVLSKNEKSVTLNRNTRSVSVTDIERVHDEILRGERRVVLQLKDNVHCNISDKEVRCGEFISSKL